MIRALVAATLASAAVVCVGAALARADRVALLARLGSTPEASTGLARRTVPITTLCAAAAVPVGLLGMAVGGVPGGLAALGVVVLIPTFVRRRRVARRAKAVQEQLPEGVSVIASGLRSGRSLVQAIELAGKEVGLPLGPTFASVADRATLGEPLESALVAWASEVGGPDARLAAGVFGLQRRTGGALSTALDDLAVTLRARRSAGRELRSLTAQARLSATILGLLPIGFFLFLSVVARSDVEAAFGTPAGSGAVILGFTLQACAYVWIRRLLRVEP